MARGKKATGPERSRGGGRGNRHTSFVPTSSFTAGSGQSFVGATDRGPGFSLRDEARHTERHHSSLQPRTQLRHTKVSFVSGGGLHTKRFEDDVGEPLATSDGANEPTVNQSGRPESAFARMSLDDEDSLRQKSAALEAGLPIIRPRFQDDLSAEELEKRPANGESYVVDTTGSGPMDTGLPAPAVRSLSPTLSDSSEEIILFAGRTVDDSKLAVRESAGAFSRTTASGQKSPCPRQSYRPPIGLGVDGSTVGRADARSSSESHTSGVAQHSGRHTPIPSNLGGTFHKRGSYFDRSQATGSSVQDSAMLDRHRKRRRRNRKFEDEHVENAVLADYIANMQGCDESESGSISHDEDTAVRDPVTEGHFNAQHREDFQDSLAWNDSDLCDFNDLSTSDEVLGTIQHILSKRERATGAQYLIVWEGYSVDDARWIPHSSLMMEGAAEKILLFESKMGLKKHSSSKDDYEDSSTEENGLHDSTDEDLEDLKDEQDLEDRRLASLTDEQIVRLLSKQEELGMGSNELMLFDAMDDDDDGDSEDDANEVGLEFSKNSHVNNLLHSTRSRGPRTRGSARQYPSATLLADVLDQDEYRGFDVMDCTRPSLKKQSKARKGALPFQLSDSDLENSLQTAWENDRNTKKAKKKEREERRAQGLLGARNQGKTNLSVKYKEGLTMDEVKSEIKSFLISEHQSIPLPPMDKRDRKLVHEIANFFKLKSKSVSQGQARFPVLYKTSRSGTYDQSASARIQARLDRRCFLPRTDRRGTKNQVVSRRTGGGASSTAVSYMDGDVVGAAAPELGIENRGRAMLERMGWSTGTALGALNNKGILQPVSHVVKTTKAGLG